MQDFPFIIASTALSENTPPGPGLVLISPIRGPDRTSALRAGAAPRIRPD